LIVDTGKPAGRPPHHKFFVHEPSTATNIAWGEVNNAWSDKDAFGVQARKIAGWFAANFRRCERNAGEAALEYAITT
jgi:ATP-dependent phosphoenolpyruvate carboxykinase